MNSLFNWKCEEENILHGYITVNYFSLRYNLKSEIKGIFFYPAKEDKSVMNRLKNKDISLGP